MKGNLYIEKHLIGCTVCFRFTYGLVVGVGVNPQTFPDFSNPQQMMPDTHVLSTRTVTLMDCVQAAMITISCTLIYCICIYVRCVVTRGCDKKKKLAKGSPSKD